MACGAQIWLTCKKLDLAGQSCDFQAFLACTSSEKNPVGILM
jgi:hypothetical protein